VPAPDAIAACACEAFEAVSRGDFVLGLLWLGPGSGPRPLVLITPPIGSGKHAIEIRALCRTLSQQGLAAAAIDLPLQGERASTKLSDRLTQCATRSERAASDRLLWDEFLRQSALDIAAATEALVRRPEILPERLACVAFEPGAEAGAGWASRDPRVRACLVVPPDAAPDSIASNLREQLA
jgi:dienelactone hydrolase